MTVQAHRRGLSPGIEPRLPDAPAGLETHASWQRDIGVAYSRVGALLQKQGKLEAAQKALEQYLAILRSVAQQDPNNAQWHLDLIRTRQKLAQIVQKSGRSALALELYAEASLIIEAQEQRAIGAERWQKERRTLEAEAAALRAAAQ